MSVRMSLYVGHIIGSNFCNVVQHPFNNIVVRKCIEPLGNFKGTFHSCFRGIWGYRAF